jgi:hypothetical protein
MNFYRTFNDKIYILLRDFDYPCRPSMFARTQVLQPKKGLKQYNLIFSGMVLHDGFQVTHHECQDHGEVCQGRGDDSIFNREFL